MFIYYAHTAYMLFQSSKSRKDKFDENVYISLYNWFLKCSFVSDLAEQNHAE